MVPLVAQQASAASPGGRDRRGVLPMAILGERGQGFCGMMRPVVLLIVVAVLITASAIGIGRWLQRKGSDVERHHGDL